MPRTGLTTVTTYSLEHFYYGQFVHDDMPDGEPRLLASTPAITEEMVTHAVERADLPPLISAADNKAWALVRGRSREIPFLLVQSQQGIDGQLTRHYTIFTSEVLKAFGGNLQALKCVLQDKMPVFDQVNVALPPLILEDAAPPTTEKQVDDILELLMVAGNRMEKVEKLLAAIVQGKPLVIQHAPVNLDARVQFIEGLLALLPSSARFGVTFTTHSLEDTAIDTQIRFFGDETPPGEGVVFSWKTGQLTGDITPDDYSRFIISQLRLDTELVIKHNDAMATIARWRLEEGDSLVDALGYAAKRIRMDEGLRTNQPVNREDVGKVLAADPTLSDDMRALYAGHLIKFSLAMKEMSYAQPVAFSLRDNVELAVSVRAQMTEALKEGQSALVYPILVDWMTNPLGPSGIEWVNLTHKALLAELVGRMKSGDVDAVNAMVVDLQATDAGVDLGRVVPTIIERTLPFMQDAELARNVFLLALKYLDSKTFIQWMNDTRFQERIPAEVARAWERIIAETVEPVPRGLLASVAAGYDAPWPALLLARLAEYAALANHFDLLDADTLAALVEVAPQYPQQALTVAQAVDEPTLLAMQPPAPLYILQLHLAAGDIAGLAKAMIFQATKLYPGDRQPDYLKAIERLFSETPISDEAVPHTLQALRENKIRAVPYVVAAVSAIYKRAAALEPVADQVSDQLLDERELLDVVPARILLRLLLFYTSAENSEGALQAARIITLAAGQQGASGVKMMVEMARLLTWNDRVKEGALQLLRMYVRGLDEGLAPRAIDYFGRELGARLRRTLHATYLLKRFMGGMELPEYARAVYVTANLLHETAALYAEKGPTADVLTNTLKTLPGRLSFDDQRRMARDVLAVGRVVVQAGRQYRKHRPRDEDGHIQKLLAGEAAPQSAPEVLRVMSGVLTRGKRVNTTLSGGQTDHPLRGRSLNSLATDFEMAQRLLHAAQETVAEKFDLRGAEVRAEIKALWDSLRPEQQQNIQGDFPTDLQRIADLIVRVGADGDAKALEDSGLAKKIASGRYRPKNTLEFYRFVAVYYSSSGVSQ